MDRKPYKSSSRPKTRSWTHKKRQSPYSRGSASSRPGNYRGHPSARRSGKRFPGFAKNLDIIAFINKESLKSPAEERDLTPKHAFADFKIHAQLKNAILNQGYDRPTPIQDSIIPHILEGKDVVGIANTGTGKTAAFLIPLIDKVLANKNEQVLVVAPTRELANQIHQELRKLSPNMGIFSTCCVGGTSIVPQIRNLRRRNNFVIGTPGRLKDLIERRVLNLSKIKTLVLDEADVMLDMGFISDMRYLVAKMPPARHTLFFCATLSKEIEKLIQEFLREPVSVSVKKRDTSYNIEQGVVQIKLGEDKIEMLIALLNQSDFDKVLIFGRTKHGVEKLSRDLHRKGLASESIHGNKNYTQRQRALSSFKESRVRILVATDVASRGLDIPNVSHVINYDMPNTYEDYIHRIGRTGRWGKKGKALTFL